MALQATQPEHELQKPPLSLLQTPGFCNYRRLDWMASVCALVCCSIALGPTRGLQLSAGLVPVLDVLLAWADAADVSARATPVTTSAGKLRRDFNMEL